jgi:hypothetical protein
MKIEGLEGAAVIAVGKLVSDKEASAASSELKGAPEQIIWPVQCSCGHLFLEKYLLPKPNDNGEVGFCWCGFCQTRLNVKAQTWE